MTGTIWAFTAKSVRISSKKGIGYRNLVRACLEIKNSLNVDI